MESQSLDRISIPRVIEPPALALGPVEAFVLSKVDGRRSISDLAVIVGLAEPEVEAILHRLAAMGAVIVDVRALDERLEGDRESSRPTTPSSDDPFARFDRTTSPGEVSEDVLRAAGAAMPRRGARI